jgi:geranylgeranyl diphosphate synthase type II
VSEPIALYLTRWRTLVEQAIADNLPPSGTEPAVIHEAMRYAVLAGGKRIRPILAIAAAEAVGAAARPLLRSFAALELIHTYSLVHDDLPALDDDELRRGRKTTHVVFGEAIGILAGDALLTEAFSWLSRPGPELDPRLQLRALEEVAHAIDSRGMIGGQVADLEAERAMEESGDHSDLAARLDFIHRNKTGRLLTASVLLGGILGGASEPVLDLLTRYGRAVGLAFQIVDDLLDTEESAETLGKTAGKDAAQGKLTFPALFGVEEARKRAENLLAEAVAVADMIGGPVNYLPEIARYICQRRS